jgi:hypothetical protein
VSEGPPEPGGGGQKKLFGLPRNVVIIGAVAFAGTILYLWWRNRNSSSSQQGTSAGTATTTTSGTDESGQIAALQSEIEQLQQSGATTSSGGSSGGGGGSWSGWGGDSGSWQSGSGGDSSSSGSSPSGSSTSSSSTGSSSSGGTPHAPWTSPPNIIGRANGSQIVFTWGTVGGATSYRFQIAEPNGQLWYDKTTTAQSATFDVAPMRGTYHFKIAAVNSAGQGPWSAVKTVTVTS